MPEFPPPAGLSADEIEQFWKRPEDLPELAAIADFIIQCGWRVSDVWVGDANHINFRLLYADTDNWQAYIDYNSEDLLVGVGYWTGYGPDNWIEVFKMPLNDPRCLDMLQDVLELRIRLAEADLEVFSEWGC